MIDVENKLRMKLDSSGIPNVYVSDQNIEFTPPAVFISAQSIVGNKNEGLVETTVIASCIAKKQYAALQLATEVRDCLDGYGGDGIDDVEHVSTIPVRYSETAPVTHTFVVTFRVLTQEQIRRN